jgi:hypothetical protein
MAVAGWVVSGWVGGGRLQMHGVNIDVSCVCRGRGVDLAVLALLRLGMWSHVLQVATGLPVCIPTPTIAESARTVHIVPFLMRALSDGGY